MTYRMLTASFGRKNFLSIFTPNHNVFLQEISLSSCHFLPLPESHAA